jgi:hypothetical protein
MLVRDVTLRTNMLKCICLNGFLQIQKVYLISLQMGPFKSSLCATNELNKLHNHENSVQKFESESNDLVSTLRLLEFFIEFFAGG